MKKFLKVIWGIFAVIGILFTACFIYVLIWGDQSYPSRKERYGEFVDLLQESGPFAFH